MYVPLHNGAQYFPPIATGDAQGDACLDFGLVVAKIILVWGGESK